MGTKTPPRAEKKEGFPDFFKSDISVSIPTKKRRTIIPMLPSISVNSEGATTPKIEGPITIPKSNSPITGGILTLSAISSPILAAIKNKIIVKRRSIFSPK